MPYINSSAIAWADYDDAAQELDIRFTSGSTTYTYFGVPEYIYQGLLSASSAGQYFNENIRDQYSRKIRHSHHRPHHPRRPRLRGIRHPRQPRTPR